MFSIPVSAWVAAILLINEVPDIQADGATGKRTLPVRLGNGGTAILYIAIHILALATTVHLAAVGQLPIVAPLVPALTLILVFRAAAAIKTGVGDRTTMTAGIEATLGVHTIGCIWLAGLTIFRIFWPG
jgi:1,4-dihydroxy-2-naphthoate octaprenyltransferase